MLTGRQMFEGETVSHVLAAVLTRLTFLPAGFRSPTAVMSRKDPRKMAARHRRSMSLVQTRELVAARATARAF